MTPILLIAITLSAIACIVAYQRGKPELAYIFKTLTTILIIVLALSLKPHTDNYQYLIILGLIFSLFGDIFLMLPQEQFVRGLLSFLLAQVVYSVAFADGFSIPALIILLLFGAGTLYILIPHLGSYKIPVMVYMAVILTMGFTAISRYLESNPTGAAIAAVGAIFFMASDTILAFDRFRHSFPSARIWVLSTYWIAQTLIALSIAA